MKLILRDLIQSVNVHQVPALGWCCAGYWDTEERDTASASQELSSVKGTSELDRCDPVSSSGLPRGAQGCRLSVAQYSGVLFLRKVWERASFSFLHKTSMDHYRVGFNMNF